MSLDEVWYNLNKKSQRMKMWLWSVLEIVMCRDIVLMPEVFGQSYCV